MSTFAKPAAEAVRRCAPVDAAALGAELNNLACVIGLLLVDGPEDDALRAGVVDQLRELAHVLTGENDAHDLADILQPLSESDA